MLLSHSNLHLWIPAVTAWKALHLCTGSRMRRAWDEGFTFIFETTSTEVQHLQFFPAGRVLATGKEGAGRPRSGCRHSGYTRNIGYTWNTRNNQVCSPSLDVQPAPCNTVCLSILRTGIFERLPKGQAQTPQAQHSAEGWGAMQAFQQDLAAVVDQGVRLQELVLLYIPVLSTPIASLHHAHLYPALQSLILVM